eukprot:tig00000459_g1152.t1
MPAEIAAAFSALRVASQVLRAARLAAPVMSLLLRALSGVPDEAKIVRGIKDADPALVAPQLRCIPRRLQLRVARALCGDLVSCACIPSEHRPHLPDLSLLSLGLAVAAETRLPRARAVVDALIDLGYRAGADSGANLAAAVLLGWRGVVLRLVDECGVPVNGTPAEFATGVQTVRILSGLRTTRAADVPAVLDCVEALVYGRGMRLWLPELEGNLRATTDEGTRARLSLIARSPELVYGPRDVASAPTEWQ